MHLAHYNVCCVHLEHTARRRQQLRLLCVLHAQLEPSVTHQAQRCVPSVLRDQRIRYWELQNATNARLELMPSLQDSKYAMNALLEPSATQQAQRRGHPAVPAPRELTLLLDLSRACSVPLERISRMEI